MFGIVMDNCHPFERRAEVLFHPLHQIARQPVEIKPVAEFGRDDDLPKPLIT
jgi:hypothetical protein